MLYWSIGSSPFYLVRSNFIMTYLFIMGCFVIFWNIYGSF